MKYHVDVNGEPTLVEVEAGAAALGPTTATLDPSDGTPARTLRVGDRVLRVLVRSGSGKGRYVLEIEGHRYDVEALDERALAIRELTARHAPPPGPAPVLAPMPGLVVRVNVQVGEAVSPGQSLLVMEAMKMENELRASTAGTVRTVRVGPGTPVDKGTVLVELE